MFLLEAEVNERSRKLAAFRLHKIHGVDKKLKKGKN